MSIHPPMPVHRECEDYFQFLANAEEKNLIVQTSIVIRLPEPNLSDRKKVAPPPLDTGDAEEEVILFLWEIFWYEYRREALEHWALHGYPPERLARDLRFYRH